MHKFVHYRVLRYVLCLIIMHCALCIMQKFAQGPIGSPHCTRHGGTSIFPSFSSPFSLFLFVSFSLFFWHILFVGNNYTVLRTICFSALLSRGSAEATYRGCEKEITLTLDSHLPNKLTRNIIWCIYVYVVSQLYQSNVIFFDVSNENRMQEDTNC